MIINNKTKYLIKGQELDLINKIFNLEKSNAMTTNKELFEELACRMKNNRGAITTTELLNSHNLLHVYDILMYNLGRDLLSKNLFENNSDYYALTFYFRQYSYVEKLQLFYNICLLKKTYPNINLHNLGTKKDFNLIYKSSLSADNFPIYINLLNNDLIDKIPEQNFYEIIDRVNSYGNNTKKHINFLIEAFCYSKNDKILELLANRFKDLKLINPLFHKIKTKELLEEINKGKYNSKASEIILNELKDESFDEDYFLMKKPDTIKFDLDIINISVLKRDTLYGKQFVGAMYSFFLYAKEKNIDILNSYVSKDNNIRYLKDKISCNSYNPIAQFLNPFEFIYNDENDKQTKENIIKQFFKASLEYNVNNRNVENNETYEIIFNNILLKHKLYNTNNEVKNKTKPNKI